MRLSHVFRNGCAKSSKLCLLFFNSCPHRRQAKRSAAASSFERRLGKRRQFFRSHPSNESCQVLDRGAAWPHQAPDSGRERSHRLRPSKRMFPCRREDLSKAIQFRTCHLLNFVKHTETRLQSQEPQLGASGPPVIDDSDGGARRTERQPRCGPQGNVFKPELTRALPAFCSSTNVAFSLANKPSKVFRSASEVTTDASLRSLSKFLSLINLSISRAFPLCD